MDRRFLLLVPISIDILAVFVSFLASLLVLGGLLTVGRRFLRLDIPNERSVHAIPVPRSGGLAILLGGWFGWALLPNFPRLLFLCSVALMLLSWIDDKYRLPVLPRLIVQAMVIAFYISSTHSSFVFLPIILVALIWVTNLYNFMDGSDGLAGGMTILGFGFYAAAAKLAGDQSFFLLSSCISVSAVPFLVLNFHPAKIFMGDVGSIPLGFLAGALGFMGWQRGLWPLWYPLLVFAPFIMDASLTLIKRIIAREKFWLPHRSHYYQRFLLMGAGHRNTFLFEFILMLACGSSAIVGLFLPESAQYFLLMSWVVICAFLVMIVDRRWKRFANEAS